MNAQGNIVVSPLSFDSVGMKIYKRSPSNNGSVRPDHLGNLRVYKVSRVYEEQFYIVIAVQ